MNSFELKPGFMLGVTVPAGRFAAEDGAHAEIALMRSMRVQTCRLSVDWARIEPREGEFDGAELDRLKENLMFMLALGVRPLITLFEDQAPLWFEEGGGWLGSYGISAYLRYVEYVVRGCAHLCREFLTMSRANEYALSSCRSGARYALQSNLACAHVRAYRLIKDICAELGFRDSSVSFSNTFRVFEPRRALNPFDRAAASAAGERCQRNMNLAMLTGEFIRPLKRPALIRRGLYADFHAVGYFSRCIVTPHGEYRRTPRRCGDNGVEVYPAGLQTVCRELYELAKMPIYVVDNGVADAQDAFRSRFIYEHLHLLSLSELPVKRYYYRSFEDFFTASEHDGEKASGGDGLRLVASGEFFRDIVENGGVSEELYSRCVEGSEYRLFSDGR